MCLRPYRKGEARPGVFCFHVGGRAGTGFETRDGERGGLLRGPGGSSSLRTGENTSPQALWCPACGPRQVAGCQVTWVSWHGGV